MIPIPDVEVANENNYLPVLNWKLQIETNRMEYRVKQFVNNANNNEIVVHLVENISKNAL